MDATNGVMTITWDDVAAYSKGNSPNAFQLQLVNEGNGNFDIVYRYENISWLLGDASRGLDARAGYNAQDGQHAFELPQSGLSQMLSLPTMAGNTGIPGVWVFDVRSGDVVSPNLGTTGSFSFDDVDLSDVHTLAVAPVGTTLGTLTPVITTDSTGIGSGLVTWTYDVASSAVTGLSTRVEKEPTQTAWSLRAVVKDPYGRSVELTQR